jgi:hypothetical protein
VIQLLGTAYFAPTSPNLYILMIEAICFSETSGSLLQFLVTANVVSSSLLVYTVMMEAICSSETSESLLQLLVTNNVVPSSLILSTLLIEAICSRDTSVLTRTTRSHIPEDGILRSHRREDLKSYIALTDLAL